jgi:hypothetical protein
MGSVLPFFFWICGPYHDISAKSPVLLRGHRAGFPSFLLSSLPLFSSLDCLYFLRKAINQTKQTKESISPTPCTTKQHHHGNGDPPPAISATTTEVIDFSIEFGFAILNYVPL